MLEICERLKDARVVYNKNGSQTMREVEDETGVSKSAISDLENGKRGVDYRKVASLAKHYGVSADWLLGLSEVRTTDSSLKETCNRTGIREDILRKIWVSDPNGCAVNDRWHNYDLVNDLLEIALDRNAIYEYSQMRMITSVPYSRHENDKVAHEIINTARRFGMAVVQLDDVVPLYSSVLSALIANHFREKYMVSADDLDQPDAETTDEYWHEVREWEEAFKQDGND